MKIVVATANAGKVREIKEIFSNEEIVSMKEMGIDIDIEENGTTFEENALIKARTVAKLCDCPVLSDDSGLCVDALDGAPGIYSARYAGVDKTDEERCQKLLFEMKDKTNRTARFISAVALCYPDGRELTAEGRVEGEIGFEPVGKNGFGYDPIFISHELKKTFALATSEEKNSISHRKRALEKLYKMMGE